MCPKSRSPMRRDIAYRTFQSERNLNQRHRKDRRIVSYLFIFPDINSPQQAFFGLVGIGGRYREAAGGGCEKGDGLKVFAVSRIFDAKSVHALHTSRQVHAKSFRNGGV